MILRGTGLEGSTRLKKTFCSSLVAPLLQQNVEFGAVLIDCTPQQIRFAAQCDEHFVKMPRAVFTRRAKPAPNLSHQHRIVPTGLLSGQTSRSRRARRAALRCRASST